jgi:phenylalanyl-tRNA synthetase beta chain
LISNPVAETRDALRLSLLGGLLDAVALNARREQPGARLFELSSAFWPQPSGQPPAEPRLLALAEQVPQSERRAEVASLRSFEAAVRLLLERLLHASVFIRQSTAPGFHPGRTGEVLVEGQEVGMVGEVHPALLDGWELRGRVLAGELLFDRMLELRRQPRAGRLPRFPGVRRDLTVLVRGRLAGNDLVQVIRELGGYTLREVSMLSEYEGPQLGAGARSLSFRLQYGRDDRTLTGDEVGAIHQRIVDGLKQRFGVEVSL